MPFNEQTITSAASGDTKPQLSTEQIEKLERQNYNLSQKIAWEEWQRLGLNESEAVKWFDAKYGAYGEVPVALRDSEGQLIGEKKFSDLTANEKRNHSYGLLKLITGNYNLEFIRHFINEPELLDLADQKGINLKRTLRAYQDNRKEMGLE